MRIVVATDYSEAALNAERYAVQFAMSVNAELYFLHVYDIPFGATPAGAAEYGHTAGDWRSSELKCLEQHRNELIKTMGIRHSELKGECVVRKGTVARQTAAGAKSLGADLVIAGTHGQTGYRDVFFGTHAWDIIKRSQVPVLSIAEESVFSGISKIVFAAEYRDGEIPGIAFLDNWSKTFGSSIDVVHVSSYAQSKKYESETFQRFSLKIRNSVTDPKLKVRLMKDEDVVEGLDKYCRDHKADWLAMSHEAPFPFDRIFFPNNSVTRKMSLHTHIPLLAIPDYYSPEVSFFLKLLEPEQNA
ncbi:MAG: universal stress protein [Bacteroidota bacterium]